MYHVNPATGNPGLCKAVYSCPFGGGAEHYDTSDEARTAFESAMGEATLSMPEPHPFDRRPNADLLEECDGGIIEYEGVKFARDYTNYDSEVYLGRVEALGGTVGLEIWHNSNRTVAGWIENYEGGSKEAFTFQVRPQELDNERLTPHAKAIVIEELFASAKELQPETYDQAHPAFIKREELMEEIKSGFVTLNGVELRNTYSHAPQIWESNEVTIPGVKEVYMRERHGFAQLRVVQDTGETVVLYSEDIDQDREWSDSSKAIFFTKAHDALVTHEALNT